MPKNFRYVSHKNDVLALIRNATAESLEALAKEIEAQTKANIVANDQVDTGFMLNSTFSGLVGEGEAVVGVGADYAIYQEARNSFLFRAAQQLRGQMVGEIIKPIFLRRFGKEGKPGKAFILQYRKGQSVFKLFEKAIDIATGKADFKPPPFIQFED